jgi:hypothetical protein
MTLVREHMELLLGWKAFVSVMMSHDFLDEVVSAFAYSASAQPEACLQPGSYSVALKFFCACCRVIDRLISKMF